jgi:hypothetical protein
VDAARSPPQYCSVIQACAPPWARAIKAELRPFVMPVLVLYPVLGLGRELVGKRPTAMAQANVASGLIVTADNLLEAAVIHERAEGPALALKMSIARKRRDMLES